MHKLVVAVVIPAYKAGRFLNKTIERVCAKTILQWEDRIAGERGTDAPPEWLASTGIRYWRRPESWSIVERNVGGTPVAPARPVLNGRILKPRL